MRLMISISAVLALAGLLACGTPPKPEPVAAAPILAAKEAPAPSEREAELANLERQEQLKQDLATFNQDHPGLLDASQQEALERCEAQECLDMTRGKLGVSFSVDNRVPARVPFWGKACMAGISEACEKLASSYITSFLFPMSHLGSNEQNRAKGIDYADRACRLDLMTCRLWAEMAISVPETRERAAEKLKEACDQEQVPACEELGKYLERGEELPQDLPAARELYLRACKLGMPEEKDTTKVCLIAGNMLLEGVGGPAKVEEALAMLEPLCTPDSPDWVAGCEGEPKPFSERCHARWHQGRETRCLPLAEHWQASNDAARQAAAERLFTMTCIDGPTHRSKGLLQRCLRWGEHLKATGAPELVLSNWGRVICRLKDDVCMQEARSAGREIAECFKNDDRCDESTSK